MTTMTERIERLHRRLENAERLQALQADALENTQAALTDVELAVQGQRELPPAVADSAAPPPAEPDADVARAEVTALMARLDAAITDGPVDGIGAVAEQLRCHLENRRLI